MANLNPRNQGSPDRNLRPDTSSRKGRTGIGWYWIFAIVMGVTLVLTFLVINGEQSHQPLEGSATPTTTSSGNTSDLKNTALSVQAQ